MVFAFDTFNYGNMFDFHAEIDMDSPPDPCYYCIEGDRPDIVVWVNGDNRAWNSTRDSDSTNDFSDLANMYLKMPFGNAIVGKDFVDDMLGNIGCINDCELAKKDPSIHNKEEEEEEGEEEGEEGEEEEYQQTGNGGNYSYPPQQQNTNLVPLVVGGALLLGLVVIIS